MGGTISHQFAVRRIDHRSPSIMLCLARGGDSLSTREREKWKGKKEGIGREREEERMEGRKRFKKAQKRRNLLVE